MAFIVDRYNRFDSWDRAHARFTFNINKQWYGIMEIRLEWGLPQLKFRVDQEPRPYDYKIYNTYEEALQFVRFMISINN